MPYAKKTHENPLITLIPVNEDMTPEEMLKISNTDYRVGLAYLSAVFPEENDLRNLKKERLFFHSSSEKLQPSDAQLPEYIETKQGSRLGTIATYPNGDRESLGVVGGRYKVLQNESVLDEALTLGQILESKVSRVGRNPRGTLFGVEFDPREEIVTAYDGSSKSFSRRLYAYSSHDTSYAHSYAFVIADPEDRFVGRCIAKQKHTKGLREQRLSETLKTLAAASDIILEDIRILAQVRITDTQLDRGLRVLARESPKRGQEIDQDLNEEDDDVDAPRVDNEESREQRMRRILSRFSERKSEYGNSGWALYEAWMDVRLDENGTTEEGPLFDFILSRSNRTVLDFDRKRTDLVAALVKR